MSANVLESAGDGRPLLISGMAWQAGVKRRLSARALGAKVLCERHNQALSPLDVVAGEVFRVLRRYQSDLVHPVDPHGDEFAWFQGDLLERWAIKLFWGGVAAGAFEYAGVRISSLRSSVDPKWMAEVLFRGESLPLGWGLYTGGRPGVGFSGKAEIALQSESGPDVDLWAGGIEFGAISFRLCFGTPAATDVESTLNRHPQGIFVTSGNDDRQKVLALSWDDEGGPPIILTRMAAGTSSRTPSDW